MSERGLLLRGSIACLFSTCTTAASWLEVSFRKIIGQITILTQPNLILHWCHSETREEATRLAELNDQGTCPCSLEYKWILSVLSLYLSTNQYGHMFADCDAYRYHHALMFVHPEERNKLKPNSAIIYHFLSCFKCLALAQSRYFACSWVQKVHVLFYDWSGQLCHANSMVCRRKPLL